MQKRVKRTAGHAKTGDKNARTELVFWEKVEAHLESGKPVRLLERSEEEQEYLAHIAYHMQQIAKLTEEHRQLNTEVFVK